MSRWHTFNEFPNARHGGIIVPQKVYISGQIFEPLHSIRFYEHGQHGISLKNAFVEDFSGMVDRATQPTLRATESPRIACRIEWPGYTGGFSNLNVVDRTATANPITKAKLANYIARAVWTFMQENAGVAPDGSAPHWLIPNINFEKLYLLEFQHVSVGSWQPVLFYIP